MYILKPTARRVRRRRGKEESVEEEKEYVEENEGVRRRKEGTGKRGEVELEEEGK